MRTFPLKVHCFPHKLKVLLDSLEGLKGFYNVKAYFEQSNSHFSTALCVAHAAWPPHFKFASYTYDGFMQIAA